MHAYRTHTCADLRAADVDATARLSGWIHRKRDHGGLLFIDLRDHHGLTQIVARAGSDALPPPALPGVNAVFVAVPSIFQLSLQPCANGSKRSCVVVVPPLDDDEDDALLDDEDEEEDDEASLPLSTTPDELDELPPLSISPELDVEDDEVPGSSPLVDDDVDEEGAPVPVADGLGAGAGTAASISLVSRSPTPVSALHARNAPVIATVIRGTRLREAKPSA